MIIFILNNKPILIFLGEINIPWIQVKCIIRMQFSVVISWKTKVLRSPWKCLKLLFLGRKMWCRGSQGDPTKSQMKFYFTFNSIFNPLIDSKFDCNPESWYFFFKFESLFEKIRYQVKKANHQLQILLWIRICNFCWKNWNWSIDCPTTSRLQ